MSRLSWIIPFIVILFLFSCIMDPAIAEDPPIIKSITGSVVDKDGPIANQTVILKAHDMGGFLIVSETVTDGLGNYKFEGFESYPVFFIEIEHGGIKHTNVLKAEPGIDLILSDFSLLGELEGVIKEEDQTPLSGITVTLTNLFGTTLTSTITGIDGKYSFSSLNINETYVVTFTYDDIPYAEYVVLENKTIFKQDFSIYGSTMDDKDVQIGTHYIEIMPTEGSLYVREFLTYRNSGNKIFKDGMLKVGLPSDRHDFATSCVDCQIQEYEDYILIGPKEPIYPGQMFNTSVEYDVDFNSKERIFEKKTDYATDTFVFFVENVGRIQTEPIEGVGEVKSRILENREYQIAESNDIGPDYSISIKLSGLPTAMNKWYNALWIIPFIAVVALILVHPIIKYDSSEKNKIDSLTAEKNKLFSKIKKAEDEFDKGNISKNECKSIKLKNKERIIKLTEEIDELKDQKKRR